jgi:prefoldin beta subunit
MSQYQQQQIQQQFMLAVQQYNEYNQKLQKNAEELTATRQNEATILSQLNENNIVKKEFDLLSEDAEIYKLIGPVLVKQDHYDAKTNVEKRIEYLQKEEERLKKRHEELEKENMTLYGKMVGIQQWIIKQQQMPQQQQ